MISASNDPRRLTCRKTKNLNLTVYTDTNMLANICVYTLTYTLTLTWAHNYDHTHKQPITDLQTQIISGRLGWCKG